MDAGPWIPRAVADPDRPAPLSRRRDAEPGARRGVRAGAGGAGGQARRAAGPVLRLRRRPRCTASRSPSGRTSCAGSCRSLGDTVKQANREAWAGQELELKVGIEGMWFQCSRHGAFHDVHTHGNCSWSSAYIVQIDEPEQRVAHPVYGAANGVTRLYGPPFKPSAARSSTSATRTCSRRRRTSSRSPGSSCCSRRGSRIRRCPTTARRSGSSSPSTPASTRRGGDQLHGYSAT